MNTSLYEPLIEDNNDRIIRDEEYKDIVYIGLTNNTILHLLACSENDTLIHTEKIIELLDVTNDDFLYKLNSCGETCLHVAAYYNNVSFMKIIASYRSVNYQVKNTKKFTALHYACIKCREQMIIHLIYVGVTFDDYQIDMISNMDVKNNICEYILSKLFDFSYSHTSISTFKIFYDSDLCMDTSKHLGNGSYSSVILAVDRHTHREYALKKFKISHKNDILDDSTLKDIIFTKELSLNEHSVNIYGVYVDKDSNIYMVMEPLICTIITYIKILSNLRNTRKSNQLLHAVFQDCITAVDNNSKMGIIHGDTKMDNMMVDKSGKIKYIDYGFSYFLGISANKDNIDHPIHSGSYLSRDGAEENTIQKYLLVNENDSTVVDIPMGYIGYNLDIASIAMIFVHSIIDYNKTRFVISYNNVLYYMCKLDDNKMYKAQVNINFDNILLKFYGQSLLDLIKNMLHVDANKRYNSKKILSILHNKDYKEPSFNLLNIKNVKEPEVNIYNTLTNENYRRVGAVYFDDIMAKWKHQNINFMDVSSLEKSFDIAKKFVKYYSICLDTFFSAIYYVHHCIYRSDNSYMSPFTTKELTDNRLIIISILSHYCHVYSNLQIDNSGIIHFVHKLYPHIGISVIKDLLETTNKKLIKDADFYSLRPTMMYVGFIKYKLQATCTDMNIINTLILQIITKIIYYLTSGKLIFENHVIKVYDLVNLAYSECENTVDIGVHNVLKYKFNNVVHHKNYS